MSNDDMFDNEASSGDAGSGQNEGPTGDVFSQEQVRLIANQETGRDARMQQCTESCSARLDVFLIDASITSGEDHENYAASVGMHGPTHGPNRRELRGTLEHFLDRRPDGLPVVVRRHHRGDGGTCSTFGLSFQTYTHICYHKREKKELGRLLR